MLMRKKFDRDRAYRVVIYARMSTDRQNKRSPAQQEQNIRDLIKRLKLPWTVVAVYVDSGISARTTRMRPEFLRMVSDLTSGRIDADLILVDTYERFSRADNSVQIRNKLERRGVFVCTADTSFEDPTSDTGRIMATVESVRASSNNRIKGRDVRRGKKDAVRQKKWPGGPPPLGIGLENVMETRNGIESVAYRTPVIEPVGACIVRLIFRLADERGWGGTRIKKYLDRLPQIPDRFKPFKSTTISDQLRNCLYIGRMEWGRNCTGIENEVRVVEPVEDETEWAVDDDYCESIIDRAVWDRVAAMIASRKRPTGDDFESCRGAGVALKYPLSGLVRCNECSRSMVINGSSAYTTASGEQRRYTSYVCPRYRDGDCDNSVRIPESWLVSEVFKLVRERLLFESDQP